MQNRSYSVPYDLSQSLLDTPMNGKHEVKNRRLFTLRNLACVFFATLFFFYVLLGTTFTGCDLIYKIGFAIGYWWLVYLLFLPTSTNELGYHRIKTMIMYAGKSRRSLGTRNSDYSYSVGSFYGYGLEKEKKSKRKIMVTTDGTIWFNNGKVGRFYEVIGNASNKLFMDAQELICNDAAIFYRTFPDGMSGTIVTRLSGQRVNQQKLNKKRAMNAWKATPDLYDPSLGITTDEEANSVELNPLYNLLKEEHRVLDDYVGTSFETIRQWFLIVGDDESSLENFESRLSNHIDYSGYTLVQSFRRLENQKEVYGLLHNINASPSTDVDIDILTSKTR